MNQTADKENIIMYWRNSLVDGYRLQELECEIEVDKEAVQNGNIGPEKYALIKSMYKEAMRAVKERGKEAATSKDGLNVLVCPVKLSKKFTHYQENTAGGQKELIPLWIPAVITPEGQLKPRENQFPWIARNLLEPTTQKGVTIGDIEDVEKFLTAHGQDKIWESWQSLWTFAGEMLKAMPDGELSLPRYAVVSENSYIMPDVEARGAAMNAIQVLDYIIDTKTVPPLLSRYAALDEVPVKPEMDKDDYISAMKKHIGQMNGEFPLSGSQRESLYYYLALGNGEILAVNGPPGTGKTTLMHSLIATEWVSAAVKQTEPPIIVTASSNNQAVTNMIDSFGKVAGNSKGILSERWLPGIESYGLYCPSGSASKNQENSKYQQATPGDNSFPAQNGFPARVEEADFIDNAEKYYLEKYNEFTGRPVISVKDAVAQLHQDLVCTIIQEIVKEVDKQKEYSQAIGIAEDTLKMARETYGIAPDEDILSKLKDIGAEYRAQKVQLQQEYDSIQEKLRFANDQYIDMIQLSNVTREQENQGSSILSRILCALKIKNKKAQLPDLMLRVLNRMEDEVASISESKRETAEKLKQKEAQLKTLEQDIEAIIEIQAALKTGEVSQLESMLEKHDINERYEAFLLATHYWEGRWLLEVRKMQDIAAKKIYLSPAQKVVNKWRRYAMLTPAIVSTLYVTPRLFTAWHREGEYLEAEPLLESIDLLIIDEAGQVPPELAAASLALAKKAVIVGDVLQIEPIYNITRFVDQGNLIRHGVIQNRDEYSKVQPMSASGGNAMAVAQKACPYWLTDVNGKQYPKRGMFLSEHRRCLDTIIDFCNQLAYGGQLIPMRGDEILPGALQQFNYMHIDGISSRAGSSRKNEKEAAAILDWLLLNRDYIVQKYGAGERPVKELVRRKG